MCATVSSQLVLQIISPHRDIPAGKKTAETSIKTQHMLCFDAGLCSFFPAGGDIPHITLHNFLFCVCLLFFGQGQASCCLVFMLSYETDGYIFTLKSWQWHQFLARNQMSTLSTIVPLHVCCVYITVLCSWRTCTANLYMLTCSANTTNPSVTPPFLTFASCPCSHLRLTIESR